MRKLMVLPFLALALACSDGTLVEPEPGLSPDLTVAEGSGGHGKVVKMLKLKGKGSFWLTDDVEVGCEGNPSAILISLEFEGTTTHMGRTTGWGKNCILIVPQPEPEPPVRILLSQEAEMVAANGDEIHFYGSASVGTVVTNNPDGSWAIGPVPIVGGTGRFENASGWYSISGPESTGGPFRLVGEISSVGSSK